MSEVVENIEEPTANPYNARKSWHTPDRPKTDDADSLFYAPQKQATLDEEAPEEEPQPKKRANYKKRYDDLKKHYDDRVSQFKQREEELEAQARSAQPQYEAPKSVEDLERFKSEYPDLYDTVESVAHLRSEQQVGELREQLSAIQQREAEILKREAETTLRERHPDFEDIRGDEAFHQWAEDQPTQIQDWIYNNPDDVSLASKAIDLYKLETGQPTTKTRRSPQRQPVTRESAADIVSTKTTQIDSAQPKIWTEREIAAMSIDQFDKFEDEINQAMSEGRVVKN
tara:strand:- start:1465 stop:2319 length:855 start_codon:yes stop_codon:yes gene_type:complete